MGAVVYVLSKNGKPLMPTENSGKVRRLLKSGKAEVVKRTPFTIRLTYDTTEYVQPVTLGIKPGYETMLISASNEKKEFYSGLVEMRTDIPSLLESRREARRTRRNRLRYRPARWQNRGIPQGWLAPSVRQKIDAHITETNKITSIIPVRDIVVEVAKFDIQKIMNPDIKGDEYQQGLDSYNIREYVLARDKYKCRCCKGKSKDPVLGVHHLKNYLNDGITPENWKKHYNPANTIAICRTCHDQINRGELECKIKSGGNFKEEAFANISRWRITSKLRGIYGEENVHITFGYITKNTRIEAGLPSSPQTYALSITGNASAQRVKSYYCTRRRRCHHRQIYKANPKKGGVYVLCQSPKYINGIGLWDKVEYKGRECFVTSRRRQGCGYAVLKTLTGEQITNSARMPDIKVLEKAAHPIQQILIDEQTIKD